MGELGLFGITVPAAAGAAGLDSYAYSIVMEELSRGYASVADQCGVVELVASLLTRYGDERQQEAWIPDLVSARKKAAYCIAELRPAQAYPASKPPRCAIRGAGSSMAANSGFTMLPSPKWGLCLPHQSVSWQSRHVDLRRTARCPRRRSRPEGAKIGQHASQVGR